MASSSASTSSKTSSFSWKAFTPRRKRAQSRGASPTRPGLKPRASFNAVPPVPQHRPDSDRTRSDDFFPPTPPRTTKSATYPLPRALRPKQNSDPLPPSYFLDRPVRKTKDLNHFLGSSVPSSPVSPTSSPKSPRGFTESPLSTSDSLRNIAASIERDERGVEAKHTSDSLRSIAASIELDARGMEAKRGRRRHVVDPSIVKALESMPSSPSLERMFGNEPLLASRAQDVSEMVMSESTAAMKAPAVGADFGISTTYTFSSLKSVTHTAGRSWDAADGASNAMYRGTLIRSASSFELAQIRAPQRLGYAMTVAEHTALNRAFHTAQTTSRDHYHEDEEVQLEAMMAEYCSTDDAYGGLAPPSPGFPQASGSSAPPSPSIMVTDDECRSWPVTPSTLEFPPAHAHVVDTGGQQDGIGGILDLFPSLPASPIIPHQVKRPDNPMGKTRDYDEDTCDVSVMHMQGILRDSGFVDAASPATRPHRL
jgi:hypothetical protein